MKNTFDPAARRRLARVRQTENDVVPAGFDFAQAGEAPRLHAAFLFQPWVDGKNYPDIFFKTRQVALDEVGGTTLFRR